MRSFTCPKCGGLLFFENSLCLQCGSDVGFERSSAEFVLATSETRCANAVLAECNWIAPNGGLCDCCEMTRTRPNNSDANGLAAFALAEAAKRRLLFQLDDLALPVDADEQFPALEFDLLSSTDGPVTTGHADGVITLDLAEGDDGHRETMRVRLDEPYRTLLGHFRHESGHYYWMRLVEKTPALPVFRALFGDERADYGAALGPTTTPTRPRGGKRPTSRSTPPPIRGRTGRDLAHYLHIRDALQTASAYGIVVVGPEVDTRRTRPRR